MINIENISTDVDIAYAVGTAAAAWDNVIGLMRGATHGGQALGLHVCEDVVSWGLWQYDGDGFSVTDEGLSALTDETIARLANKWQVSKRLTR